MIELVNPENINDGLIVDRERFNKALKSEIEDYIEKLQTESSNYKKLRSNFAKKMNYICNLNNQGT